MKKHFVFYYLILFAFFLFDSFGQIQTDITFSNFSILKTSKSEFDKALNKFDDSIIYDTTIHKKTNGEICFKIRNSKTTIKFVDTLTVRVDTNFSIRVYSFIGQIKSINKFIVKGEFYESVAYYLIDTVSGIVTPCDNLPILSIDKKYLASIPVSYGLMGYDRGFTIFKIEKSNNDSSFELKEHLFYEEDIWEPHEIVWNKNGDLLIKATDNKVVNSKDYFYLKVRLKK